MGANEKDKHVLNVNNGRDFKVERYGDIRIITASDPCPRCGKKLIFSKGIEVGHVFKLGTKYSNALKANFLDKHGKESPAIMGCYGIGVGRTIAAAIEQFNDKNGIVFPISIAPFEIIIVPLEIHDSHVKKVAEDLYQNLNRLGLSVFIDDRDERPGFKLKDSDLLGIPVRITISLRTLKNDSVEVKLRKDTDFKLIHIKQAPETIMEIAQGLYDSLK